MNHPRKRSNRASPGVVFAWDGEAGTAQRPSPTVMFVVQRALGTPFRGAVGVSRLRGRQSLVWINKSIPALGCACVYATDEIIYIVTIGADFTYPSTGF